MNKIVRTKTKATGGVTPEEKIKLDAVAKEWIDIAMRTAPIEPNKIVPAIKGLYATAKLKEPRVVIVPSPLVMAFAYGASAWIWHCRKNGTHAATRVATHAATHAATRVATDAATSVATHAATYAATDAATRVATDAATSVATHAATYAATDATTYAATDAATDAATRVATHAATRVATYAATHAATHAATIDSESQAAQACFALAGKGGIECAKNWRKVYQGGNMWAGYTSYLVAFRGVIDLDLPEYANFKFYEDATRHGAFRVMHEEFCIVSDFPEVIKKDEQNRPHCENGPSHRWRDGWSLYHWHGVRIPAGWIEDKANLTAKTALTWKNIEQRRTACEIVGWAKIMEELDAKVIDEDGDPEIGTLLEAYLPDSGREQFLKVVCGTGREFVIPVPKNMKSAIQANAWTYGLNPAEFQPEVRT